MSPARPIPIWSTDAITHAASPRSGNPHSRIMPVISATVSRVNGSMSAESRGGGDDDARILCPVGIELDDIGHSCSLGWRAATPCSLQRPGEAPAPPPRWTHHDDRRDDAPPGPTRRAPPPFSQTSARMGYTNFRVTYVRQRTKPQANPRSRSPQSKSARNPRADADHSTKPPNADSRIPRHAIPLRPASLRSVRQRSESRALNRILFNPLSRRRTQG